MVVGRVGPSRESHEALITGGFVMVIGWHATQSHLARFVEGQSNNNTCAMLDFAGHTAYFPAINLLERSTRAPDGAVLLSCRDSVPVGCEWRHP